MTLAELKTKLKTSGLPVAYRKWPVASPDDPNSGPPPLPYLIYYEDGVDTLKADGAVYYKIHHITVDLYSKEKDQAAEAALEQAFDGLGWMKTFEEYLDSEHMMMCSYDLTI